MRNATNAIAQGVAAAAESPAAWVVRMVAEKRIAAYQALAWAA